MNFKDVIWRIAIIVMSILLVWFGLSYFEVLTKNLNGNVVLNEWNLFSFFL